jgi:hypothetical protein
VTAAYTKFGEVAVYWLIERSTTLVV